MGELDGVRAVVTGATSGLGAAMATALLEAGAQVALAARATARLETAVAEQCAAGWRAEALPLDVRDPDAVDAAAASVLRRWGGCDLLVNNAGIGMRTVNERFLDEPLPFYAVSPEGFFDVIATNLTGYFLVARAFAPAMVAARRGRIVNVTMNTATMRRRGFVPYGPSRAGAEALSWIMTEDLAPFGVTVNQLLPGGGTATGMIPTADGPRRPELLDPGIMGPPIVFLASAAAAGITGERIVAKDFAAWRAARAAMGDGSPADR